MRWASAERPPADTPGVVWCPPWPAAPQPDTTVDGSASLRAMSTVHYDMPDPGFLSDGAVVLLTVCLLTAMLGWAVLNFIRSRRIGA